MLDFAALHTFLDELYCATEPQTEYRVYKQVLRFRWCISGIATSGRDNISSLSPPVTSMSISFSTEARLGGKKGSSSSLVVSGEGKY